MAISYQLASNSNQAKPWREDCGCARWLLCQPSPKVNRATQKAVSGTVSRGKASRSPHVGGGVDEPGGLETEDGAKTKSPKQVWPPANKKEEQAKCSVWHPVPPVYPHVELVFAEIGMASAGFRFDCGEAYQARAMSSDASALR